MYPTESPHDLAPALHLVACRTATGSVTFFATRHPTEQLIHLGVALIVEERLVIPTPHAERIVRELQAEFAEERLTMRAGRPYFQTDWARVESAVAEFDCTTGKRLRRDGVAVGDRVHVATSLADQQVRQRGEVTAISERRYLVKLDQPVNDVVAGWYGRSLIKPIIRAVCLRDAAGCAA